MQKNTRARGSRWEESVADYLSENGVTVLDRNFRCRSGEIDIIGRDGEYLVFFEVKYRSSDTMGAAQEAVDYRKQLKICRVSDVYRLRHGIGEDADIRYDVVAINGTEMNWIRNAFPYQRGRLR